MSGTSKRNGQCICGSVKITAYESSNHIGACHCGTCRKWGGGPYMELDCGSNVEFEGLDNISIFNSSEWAERGFCNKCGSHLFYRLKELNKHLIPVGIFDNQSELVFDHQVFIDEKPGYYQFTNKTHDMTAAEIFAKFSNE